MPDSFAPLTWGPPFDERDLEALLSGDMADTPRALRQVADALAALRAAPTPAELSGEAAARAGFRAGPGEVACADGYAHTLILPAQAPDRPGKRPARHRSGRGAGHARPHGARPSGQRLGLMAAAAAALIVAVIAVMGTLPGPMHRTRDSSAVGPPSASHSSASGAGSQNVQAGSATPEPTHHATPTHAAHQIPSDAPPSPQSRAKGLCRDFYDYFVHPKAHDKLSAEVTLYWEIASLAGTPSRFNVNTFCGPYVSDMFSHGVLPGPWSPGGGPITPLGGQNGPGNPDQGTVGQPASSNGTPGQAK